MCNINVEICHSTWAEIFWACDKKVDMIGNKIPIPIFTENQIISICDLCIEKLKTQPTLVHVSGPINVVGDIHGNLHDLLRILFNSGLPPQTSYLFLGDYVDRGNYSLEVVTLLLTMFLIYPDSITLIRGNHETRDVNSVYGFKDEVLSIYGSLDVFDKVNEVFDYLPLSVVINNRIACFHGGISPDLHSMEQILQIKKPITNVYDKLVKNILWSDPVTSSTYFSDHTQRASSVTFGTMAQDKFLRETKMEMIIRAHQCVQVGVEKIRKCITVFSSSNYSNNNNSAILHCDKHSEVKVIKFNPLDFNLSRENAKFIHISESCTCSNYNNLAYPLAIKAAPSVPILISHSKSTHRPRMIIKFYSCKLAKNESSFPLMTKPAIKETFLSTRIKK